MVVSLVLQDVALVELDGSDSDSGDEETSDSEEGSDSDEDDDEVTEQNLRLPGDRRRKKEVQIQEVEQDGE